MAENALFVPIKDRMREWRWGMDYATKIFKVAVEYLEAIDISKASLDFLVDRLDDPVLPTKDNGEHFLHFSWPYGVRSARIFDEIDALLHSIDNVKNNKDGSWYSKRGAIKDAWLAMLASDREKIKMQAVDETVGQVLDNAGLDNRYFDNAAEECQTFLKNIDVMKAKTNTLKELAHRVDVVRRKIREEFISRGERVAEEEKDHVIDKDILNYEHIEKYVQELCHVLTVTSRYMKERMNQTNMELAYAEYDMMPGEENLEEKEHSNKRRRV